MTTQTESLEKVDKKKRYKQILEVLEKYPKGLSAREISTKLGYIERNATAPRLTELEGKWQVKRNGTKYDKITNRNVTVYIIDKVVRKEVI